jgi:hypothetical protein
MTDGRAVLRWSVHQPIFRFCCFVRLVLPNSVSLYSGYPARLRYPDPIGSGTRPDPNFSKLNLIPISLFHVLTYAWFRNCPLLYSEEFFFTPLAKDKVHVDGDMLVPVLRIRSILMWMRIQIRILPLTFPHIWTLQCPYSDPLKLQPFRFHVDLDPALHFDADPDSAFHFDTDPDPASQNEADPDTHHWLVPPYLVCNLILLIVS